MARVTVENCLKKMGSRFELVMLSTQRVRQLLHKGLEPLVPRENDKETVIVLREIEEGHIDPKKLADLAREHEQELQAAEAGVSDSFMAGTVASPTAMPTTPTSPPPVSAVPSPETTSRLHTLNSTPSLFEQVASQPGPVKIVNEKPVAADQLDDIPSTPSQSIDKEIMSLSEAIAKKEAEDKAKQDANESHGEDANQSDDTASSDDD